jgi:hypothetical protein
MDSMFTCEQRPSRRERRDAERMDSLHRIVTGQASNRRELNVAGFFIAGWFVMDLVQWVDWLVGKFH